MTLVGFAVLQPFLVFAAEAPTTTTEAQQFAEALEDAENYNPQEPSPIQDVFFRAEILELGQPEEIDDFGVPFITQPLRVRIIEGEERGKELDLAYEARGNEARNVLEIGDKVVVGRSLSYPDLNAEYYVADVYRLGGLMWLLAFFLFTAVAFAGKHGVRSFAGLLLSFVVIMYYIVPQILDGANPFLVSFLGTIAIASSALFIAHGIKTRTTIAFVSTIITILLALVLSYISVIGLKLFGLGSEEAYYLQFAGDVAINLQGLLLGGLIIGTLGVLDDVTTAQAAAVDEIHKANHRFGLKELYKRGASVGKEHIVSLVNTLVLAYTGASFPLLLLFHIYTQPLWLTLNSEIMVEELVRMLVGSIALIFAVPITTMLAAYVYTRKKKG